LTPNEIQALLPMINNARIVAAANVHTVGNANAAAADAVAAAIRTAAGQANAAQTDAKGRQNRRWWRSLHRPRLFQSRRAQQQQQQQQAKAASTLSGSQSSKGGPAPLLALPGPRTILTQLAETTLEQYGFADRAMGCLTSHSAVFHAASALLDDMWSTHEERLLGSLAVANKKQQQQQQQAPATAANGNSASNSNSNSAAPPAAAAKMPVEEAFPSLSTLPINLFWDRTQPAAHRRAAHSPLWDLLRRVVLDARPKNIGTKTALRGPFDDPNTSPMIDAAQTIGAIVALELDMALHELLVQCATLHTDRIAEFAFPSVAPTATKKPASPRPPASAPASPPRERGEAPSHKLLREAAEHAAAADAAYVPGAGGNDAAFKWLQTSLKSLYAELLASAGSERDAAEAAANAPVDAPYAPALWDSPLSVAFASEMIRLTLEQLCVLVLNENHRRIVANLKPNTEKPKKSSNNNKAPAPDKFVFTPITPEGLNVDGERVFATLEDGLQLKARLDALEGWLDNLPISLGVHCRTALVPLRSLCDLLILPADALLEEHVRRGALFPLPAPMQRALFAAARCVAWEHPDDVSAAQKARATLSTHILCPPIPPKVGESKTHVLADQHDPSAVATPFAIAFRTPEHDFSFIDFLSLSSATYGALDQMHQVIATYNRVVDEYAAVAGDAKAAKALPPVKEANLVPTGIIATQALDGYGADSELAATHADLPRELQVTALWDTATYRESIGLSSADDKRREEQLLDPRRLPEDYIAPDHVFNTITSEWAQSDRHGARRDVRMSVALALLAASAGKSAPAPLPPTHDRSQSAIIETSEPSTR
jgi:hypothetical protein